ncbi:MAG: Gfo/Idh/MocA family oxidoreductase [Pirellula sp.]|nr:Gfo/Idh/MocA family oxidoreductase [Pirellula sp.]
MVPSQIARRRVLQSAVATGTLLGLSPLHYGRVKGANSRLRIASIGTGGKGWSDLLGVAASPAVDVAALCDVDSSKEHLGRAAEKYPAAKTFDDWRRVLDSMKDLHGVLVSTPDFMHAPISLAAIQLGKHVFCQKPLTHTVFEARQMRLAAQKAGIVTQMCNQIQSHSAYRTAVHWVHSGLIGKVREVHSWQSNNPSWPRHIDTPSGADPVPSHVRWDLWQGVAAETAYKANLYHPFNWRGWQAFGTGQLGDFGCHILDPVFKALKLTSPVSLQVSAPAIKKESWTDRCTVQYLFPGTTFTAGDRLPVTWYDAAGVEPPRDRITDIPADVALPKAGSVLIGEKGTLVIPHVAMPTIYPKERTGPEKLETLPNVDHYTQWADACLGNGETTSHFDYAGPLTETVLLGTIGIRFPEQRLEWDAEKLRITNVAAANDYLTKPYRKGWEPAWV